MKNLLVVCFLCFCVGDIVSADCEPEIELGRLMGVSAFSNAPYTETGEGCYQCVQLAKRFAATYHNVAQNGFGSVGSAANMWRELPLNYGYTPIDNATSLDMSLGSATQPQVGDFVIWWGGAYGHVAIISSVMKDKVEVIEQNINNASAPYRILPMSKINGKWHLDSGERLGSYYVKGWLHYPGFSVVGRYEDGGTFNRFVVNCYDWMTGYQCTSNLGKVGWPIDDGGGTFVHKWLPWSYDCQNFRNAQGQESIIMSGAPFTSQAYLISGAIWEFYRHGYNGRYGPDIILPNGKRLGGPISNEWAGIQRFENGYYVFGKFTSSTPKANSLKSAGSLKAAINSSVTVELHQLENTLKNKLLLYIIIHFKNIINN